jgi:hypothetical protein
MGWRGLAGSLTCWPTLANGQVNFENSFLPRKFRLGNNLASGKTANWISETRFNRENHGGKQFGLVTVGALWPKPVLP